MLLPGFLNKRQVRRFSFTPFYLEVKNEEEEEEGRIKFRRIRRSKPAVKKSVRGLALLAILILFCLYYFSQMIQGDRRLEIEDIRIEQTPN